MLFVVFVVVVVVVVVVVNEVVKDVVVLLEKATAEILIAINHKGHQTPTLPWVGLHGDGICEIPVM